MGIHVPQTLLNVAEEIKVKVKLNKLTDRQLKNIVRQVKSGYIPLYANSATAHIARHIASKFDTPCIKWSSWRLQTHKLATDHPIFEAVVNAAAISKIENPERASWYTSDFNSVMEQAAGKKELLVSMYLFSDTGKKMLMEACKKGVITPDSPVHQYLDSLLNREIEYIELEPS